MECLLSWVQHGIRGISSILIILLVAGACATPSAPEGGPQDRQAPRLDPKKYSTPNPSTNFQYKRVILTFDEWVRLQAASSQVVISPPLQQKPTIKVRNKSVVVEWKEELEDSTTYIINFGDAIQDITEGNKVSDMKMVFSTGSYLDSLTCSGQVIDAATRQPKAEVWVMLYRDLADSVPKTQQPFYFTKTSSNGNFRIEYIRKGKYQIFALEDKNNDYKYNLPREPIAFLDSSFVINDSIQPFIRLLMFEERQELAVEDVEVVQFGEVKVTLNEEVQSPTQVSLLQEPSDLKMLVEQAGDSLHVWLDGTIEDTAKLKLVLYNEAEAWRDTLTLSNKDKATLLDSIALRWFVPKAAEPVAASSGRGGGQQQQQKKPTFRPIQDTTTIPQHPKKPIQLLFTAPLVSIDSNQFIWAVDTSISWKEWKYEYGVDPESGDTLFMDSLLIKVERDTFLAIALPKITRDSQQANVLYVWVDSTPNKKYQLTLLPNGVQDFWGRTNGDTLSRIYTINSTEEYGNITALVLGADSSQQYIVELVDKEKKVIRREWVQDSSSIILKDYYLPTGPYTVRVSTDLNQNRRWDVGNYDKKQQPEPRFVSKVIQLKAGWDNTMELDLNKKEEATGKGGGKKGGKQETNLEEDQKEEPLPDNIEDNQTGTLPKKGGKKE